LHRKPRQAIRSAGHDFENPGERHAKGRAQDGAEEPEDTALDRPTRSCPA
jgi:hypothetical protein